MCFNNPGSFDCECEPGFSGDGYQLCRQVDNCLFWVDDPERDDSSLIDYTHKERVDGVMVNSGDVVEGASWADDRPLAFGELLVHQCGVIDHVQQTFEEHGTCADAGLDAFVCTCDAGWSDSNCDMDINECARNTDGCHKYADCTNTPGSYMCECKQGFTGDGGDCEDVDDCALSAESCLNGFCMDAGVGDYRCVCDAGWSDRNCDANINECASMTHTCHEDAVCTDTAGSFRCACPAGFVGDGIGEVGCEDIDDCGTAPCENGACQDNGSQAYACHCEKGWKDTHCDHDVNECIAGTHDCHSMGKCVNTLVRGFAPVRRGVGEVYSRVRDD